MITAGFIIDTLGRHRFPLSDEKRLQEEMSIALTAAGIEHQREVALSNRDRIDFMVGSIGIEVKIKGAKRGIFDQVDRYVQHERVSELILATNVPMGMPAEVRGKQVRLMNLARAWL